MSFRMYDELSQLIDRSDGVMTCEMRCLRDAHGAGKLGNTVVANISAALDHRGLSHYPNPLPIYQDEKARIYKRASPVGKLIEAAFDVEHNYSDDVLRSIASKNSDIILEKIRELVCD